MNPWLVLVLSSLVSMKVVDFIKEITPWPLQPWVRSALAVGAAAVPCALLSTGWKQPAVLAVAAAGLAAIAHEVQDVLSVRGDEGKQGVMLRAGSVQRRVRM